MLFEQMHIESTSVWILLTVHTRVIKPASL